MSLKIDRLQLEVIINNDQARKSLRALDEESKKLISEMKKLDKTSQEYADSAKRLNAIKVQMDNIYNSIGITNMTLRELQGRSKELTLMKAHLRPGTEAYKQLEKELGSVNKRLMELRVQARQTGGAFDNVMQIKNGYVAVAAAIMGTVASVGKFFDAWREQEKAIQKVEQAIKSTGNAAGLSLRELKNEANDLQNTTLFGDEEILNKSTAQLLTFTNITGETFKKAQRSALDLATVLDGDLQSASIMLGKALNDPVQGLTALRRVGVYFSNDQREQIKLLAETNRLEEAQAIILGEMTRQYGGQAEAVAKGAGVWTQVKNQLGEVSEAIGGRLASATSALGENLRDLFKTMAETIGSSSIVDEFHNQASAVVELKESLNPLLDRYDKLKSKSKLTKDEQSELKNIIDKVAEAVPGAITAIDNYGNAMDINTGKAREYINEQVAMLSVMNKKAIDDTKKSLKDLETPLADAKRVMDNIMKTGTIDQQSGLNYTTRKATQQEIKDAQDKYKNLAQQKLGFETLLKNLNGDALIAAMKQREEDQKSAKDNEDKKINYKKLSIQQLNELDSEGDELAKKELERRKKAHNEEKKDLTELQVLENHINDLKTQQMQMIIKGVAAGDLRLNQISHELVQANLLLSLYKDIEATLSKPITLNKIKGLPQTSIKQFIKNSQPLLNEGLSEIDKNNSASGTAASRVPEDKKDPLLTQEEKKQIEITGATELNNLLFDISKDRRQRELDDAISGFEKQRAAELKNKNLTEKQKDEINDKYDKKIRAERTKAWKKQQLADAIQTGIKTALAVMAAAPNPAAMAVTALAGAASVAYILSQKVPEFAKGKYLVTGRQTGNKYVADYAGPAQTKLYTSPTLVGMVGDKGPEIVIDSATTKNLQMNYPEVIDAINYARVPQFASGQYVSTKTDSAPAKTQQISFSPETLQAMNNFSSTMNRVVDEGLSGNWSFFDFEKIQGKAEQIRQDTTM